MTRRKRGSVLIEAHKVINGERLDTHGKPEDSFLRISRYWSAYLERMVTPKDVAMLMTLFKIAREQTKPKRDDYRDAAGYIGIAADFGGEE